MKPTTIYAIVDSTTSEVRYIGKTVSPYYRYNTHLHDKSDSYRGRWLRSISYNVEFVELEKVFENWVEAERFWISYFRFLGARLTNTTSGGEGACDPSPEVIAKLSKARRGNSHAKGYRHTPEALEKIRQSSIGRKPALGMRHSEEAKSKISSAQKGKKLSEATLDKMREAHQKLSEKKRADMLRVWAERKAAKINQPKGV